MHRNLSESHGMHDAEIDSARAAAEKDAAECSEDIVNDLDSKFSFMVLTRFILVFIYSTMLNHFDD